LVFGRRSEWGFGGWGFGRASEWGFGRVVYAGRGFDRPT